MWNLLSFIFNTNLIANQQLDWVAIVFIILLIIIAITVFFYKKKLFLVIQSVFSQRYFSLLSREGKILNERFYILSLSIIFLSFSLFCYTLIDYFLPDYNLKISSFSLFAFSMTFTFAMYLFHLLFFRLFCYFFDYQKESNLFNLYRLFFLIVNGLVLFPVLLCYYYIPLKIIIPIYISAFIILYFFLYFRIFISKATEINLFYFFIYFCTFEILPYFIIVKLIKSLV